mgnify:FL=1
MINFTNCVEELNKFSGSEKKKTLIFEDKIYLVKFPDPILDKNKNISYINNSLSEYVGSNIFRLVGFETQETLLGKYKFNGVEKTVCACLDFTDDENELYEFENIALSANPDKKIGTELEDILEILRNSKLFDYNSIQEKFWDMFIIDSIIGNTDRHNGNWGFLVNKKTKKIEFSPIYDCGSCLNPMLEDSDIEKMRVEDFKNIVLNCYSCLKDNNKKINYMTFIKSRKNNGCNEALKRMFNKIDIEKIDSFINNISCISDVRKDFYKKIISMRYDILKKVYNELNDC